MPLAKVRPPETIANMAICMIKQTDYMLFKQLQSLGEDFLKNGGMRERMTRMRVERRK
jgi:four helix bundle suffix protein